MLFFLLNLRNFFYTRSIKNSDPRNFDYRISMSVLFMVYYMIFLALLDIILNEICKWVFDHKTHKVREFYRENFIAYCYIYSISIRNVLDVKKFRKIRVDQNE